MVQPMGTDPQTVILTRPPETSRVFAERLRDRGFQGQIVLSPLVAIAPLDIDLDLSGYSSVIFTSGTALRLVAATDIPTWVVGQRSSDMARDLGWHVQGFATDVIALYHSILAHKPMGRLLHICGEPSIGDLAGRLTQAGIPTHRKVIYRQIPQPLTDEAMALIASPEPIVIPVFSPNAASLLASNLRLARNTSVIAMSAQIAQALGDPPDINVIVTPEVSADSVITLLTGKKDTA